MFFCIAQQQQQKKARTQTLQTNELHRQAISKSLRVYSTGKSMRTQIFSPFWHQFPFFTLLPFSRFLACYIIVQMCVWRFFTAHFPDCNIFREHNPPLVIYLSKCNFRINKMESDETIHHRPTTKTIRKKTYRTATYAWKISFRKFLCSAGLTPPHNVSQKKGGCGIKRQMQERMRVKKWTSV